MGLRPLRWLVLAPQVVLSRILWLWGRMRFSALVRDKGPGCVCHWQAGLKYPERIRMGRGVIVGVRASLGAHGRIVLGDDVRISQEAQLETAGLDFMSAPAPYPHVSRPIVIENGAWIGTRALIMGGVTIGTGAVVAAGSVVTRDVPARALVAGVPARVVRILPSWGDGGRPVDSVRSSSSAAPAAP